MYFPIAPWSLFFNSIFAPRNAGVTPMDQRIPAPIANPRDQLEHEAVVPMHRRDNLADVAQAVDAASTTASSNNAILTYITPSPFASPVAITSQSQAVESFLPLLTFCAMPPLTLVSGSWISVAAPASYLNTSLATPTRTSSCDTSYIPTQTVVCATTLTGLATKITVTACEQNITFSSQFGYTFETPLPSIGAANLSISPTPTIRNLTTYYVASWQDLVATPGVAPQDVDIKICSTYSNGSTICEVEYQEWRVEIVTITTTTTSSVDVTATYPGPGEIIVHTAHWNVTDTITTFSLTTTFDLQSSSETENTSTGPRTSLSAKPTLTRTFTVVRNTAMTSPTDPEPTPPIEGASIAIPMPLIQ